MATFNFSSSTTLTNADKAMLNQLLKSSGTVELDGEIGYASNAETDEKIVGVLKDLVERSRKEIREVLRLIWPYYEAGITPNWCVGIYLYDLANGKAWCKTELKGILTKEESTLSDQTKRALLDIRMGNLIGGRDESVDLFYEAYCNNLRLWRSGINFGIAYGDDDLENGKDATEDVESIKKLRKATESLKKGITYADDIVTIDGYKFIVAGDRILLPDDSDVVLGDVILTWWAITDQAEKDAVVKEYCRQWVEKTRAEAARYDYDDDEEFLDSKGVHYEYC